MKIARENKRKYRKPQLNNHGKIKKITEGGAGSRADGNMTVMM